MDTLTPAERSRRMSLIRSKDTKPELIVRRLVYALGARYRLHARDVPGTPDLVFRRYRKAIFVHGCFWHQHSCPSGNRVPKSRVAFWRKKLEGNKARDQRKLRELRQVQWKTIVIWECEVKKIDKLRRRLARFLNITL